VKNGKWSDVGDLHNTGLQHSSRTFTEPQIKYLKDAGVDVPRYALPDEHQAIYQDLVSRFRADGAIKP
jgi:hypothetical protein